MKKPLPRALRRVPCRPTASIFRSVFFVDATLTEVVALLASCDARFFVDPSFKDKHALCTHLLNLLSRLKHGLAALALSELSVHSICDEIVTRFDALIPSSCETLPEQYVARELLDAYDKAMRLLEDVETRIAEVGHV